MAHNMPEKILDMVFLLPNDLYTVSLYILVVLNGHKKTVTYLEWS
jgi:hypothetical protein